LLIFAVPPDASITIGSKYPYPYKGYTNLAGGARGGRRIAAKYQ
jgi:hypothetical protein